MTKMEKTIRGMVYKYYVGDKRAHADKLIAEHKEKESNRVYNFENKEELIKYVNRNLEPKEVFSRHEMIDNIEGYSFATEKELIMYVRMNYRTYEIF